MPLSLSTLESRQSLQYFALLWLLITVAFFSASVSKLMPYTLPAFPAAAILFALEIEKAIRKPSRLRLLVPIALTALVYAVGIFISPMVLAKVRHVPAGLPPLVQPAFIYMTVLIMAASVTGWFNKRTASVAIFLTAQVLLCIFLAPPLTLALSKHWEGPIPDMARYVGQFTEPAFVFDMRKPGVPFYAERQMSQAWSWATLTSELGRMKRGYVITRAKNKGPFLEMPGFTVIKEEGQYLLLRFDNPFDPKEPYTASPGIHSMQR